MRLTLLLKLLCTFRSLYVCHYQWPFQTHIACNGNHIHPRGAHCYVFSCCLSFISPDCQCSLYQPLDLFRENAVCCMIFLSLLLSHMLTAMCPSCEFCQPKAHVLIQLCYCQLTTSQTKWLTHSFSSSLDSSPWLSPSPTLLHHISWMATPTSCPTSTPAPLPCRL